MEDTEHSGGRVASAPWSLSNALWSPGNQSPAAKDDSQALPTPANNTDSGAAPKTRKVSEDMIRQAIVALTDRRGSSVHDIHSLLKEKSGVDDLTDKEVRLALHRGLKKGTIESKARGRFLWFGHTPDCEKKAIKPKAGRKAAGNVVKKRPYLKAVAKTARKTKAMKCGAPAKPKPKASSGAAKSRPKKSAATKGGAKKSSGGCGPGKRLVRFCVSQGGGGGFFGRNGKGKTAAKKAGKKPAKKSAKKPAKKPAKKSAKKPAKKPAKKAMPKKKSPKKDKAGASSGGGLSSWFGCGKKST